MEPLSVGMHSATKAKIKPGDVGVVIGAGPIGMLQCLAALASGCSKVKKISKSIFRSFLRPNFPPFTSFLFSSFFFFFSFRCFWLT